jgi:mannose-6-phosphate isomerase
VPEGGSEMTTQKHDERPWGAYTVLGGADGYDVKEIVVQPGKRLSYQRHAHRSEHWYVVRGSGRVVLDGQQRDVGVGDSVDVPIGRLHRIGNTGAEPLVFVEVQVGAYLGEDDIERLEDDFGRV